MSITIDVQVSEKLLAYVDQLVKLEGFGNSRDAVVRNFLWWGVNKQLEAGRLKDEARAALKEQP